LPKSLLIAPWAVFE